MKGKNKKKRKVGKVVLIGMSFLLTVLLTFSATLAWFYDADWASNYINMAGSVGIEIRREEGKTDADGNPLPIRTSGAGNLHFTVSTPKAYPGQSIDVSASVYNNGGKSGTGGSDCYVRAHFAVYTNIGREYSLIKDISKVEGKEDEYYTELNTVFNLDSNDFETTADYYYALDAAKENAINENQAGAKALYEFFNALIEEQNDDDNNEYYWKYYQHTGTLSLAPNGIDTNTANHDHYLEGNAYENTNATIKDKGYFYLVKKDDQATLMKLPRGETAVFLWNNTFIIPWNLTNASADKYIFVGITFQAIQTFIPKIEGGIINGAANNQLPAEECTYNHVSVQTVFNSCRFTPINTKIAVADGSVIDFSNSDIYDVANTPSS